MLCPVCPCKVHHTLFRAFLSTKTSTGWCIGAMSSDSCDIILHRYSTCTGPASKLNVDARCMVYFDGGTLVCLHRKQDCSQHSSDDCTGHTAVTAPKRQVAMFHRLQHVRRLSFSAGSSVHDLFGISSPLYTLTT